MPKAWIYYIALILPLAFRVLVLNTGFDEWLWYRGDADGYYLISALKANPLFLELIGGWALPLFVCTVFIYWHAEDDHDDMSAQFLMLPIVYVPFAIAGHALETFTIDLSTFYSYPLVLIMGGYVYIFPWIAFVGVFSKLRLVAD